MTWLIEPLRRVLCGLRGHDTIMEFEQDRCGTGVLSVQGVDQSIRTSRKTVWDRLPAGQTGKMPVPQRDSLV